jgi:hypothetical protein
LQRNQTNATNKYYAGTKAADDAQPRRFGTNLLNQRYGGAQPAAKKSVERATTTSRPRTAGAVNKTTATVSTRQPVVASRRTVEARKPVSVKVDDVVIPDAGVDSSHEKRDPQQVCNYVNDIISHNRQQECKYMPDPNYLANMQSASGLATRHRVSLIDWTTEVHRKFKTLRQETLFLAINIIDRFLSKRQVAKDKLQLVGATCLLIASKMEDMWPPLVRDLVYVASNAFTKGDLKKMERTICNAIRFEVVVPTAAPFLARFSKAGQLDATGKKLATYIAELAGHDYGNLKYAPSMIAASSVALAQKMLRRGSFTQALQVTCTYSESQLSGCMRDINVLVKAPPAEMKALKNKYSAVNGTKAVEL